MTNIALLTAQFGMEWASTYVVDPLLELVEAGHIHRMTFCFAVEVLAPIFLQRDGLPTYLERFLPALRVLSTNEVPNVRFSVAKAMQVRSRRPHPSLPASLAAPTPRLRPVTPLRGSSRAGVAVNFRRLPHPPTPFLRPSPPLRLPSLRRRARCMQRALRARLRSRQ